MQANNHTSCAEILKLLESKIPYCMQTLRQFQPFGKEQSGTFKYWVSFLEAEDLLLRQRRQFPTSPGDWNGNTSILPFGLPSKHCQVRTSVCFRDETT